MPEEYLPELSVVITILLGLMVAVVGWVIRKFLFLPKCPGCDRRTWKPLRVDYSRPPPSKSLSKQREKGNLVVLADHIERNRQGTG